MDEQQAEIRDLILENSSLKNELEEMTEKLKKAQLTIKALNEIIQNIEKKNDSKLLLENVVFLMIVGALSGGSIHAYCGPDALLTAVGIVMGTFAYLNYFFKK